MPREPSPRFVELMNARYQRIIDATWGAGESLDCSYDGHEWTATIAIRPPQARNRWVTGTGPTLERALAALEKELGLERWIG
jgi:hypothetical protein